MVRLDREYALEDELPEEKRQSFVHVGQEKIVETDDPRWIASERAVLEGWDAVDQASFDLINVEPTTMAGIMALLRYAAEFAGRGSTFPNAALDEDDPGIVHKKNGAPFSYFIYKNVADALEDMAAVAGKAVQS
jgi:hypothetical protein